MTARQKLIKKADELWSQKIRSIGKCQRCGSVKYLQAAHIFSRKRQNLRWDLDNGLCLCRACHLFWAHKEPIEFAHWVETVFANQYANVLEKKLTFDKIGEYNINKLDINAVITQLKG